jgi:CRP-like cAMP-binding protein/CheY-like chemotaxis protein
MKKVLLIEDDDIMRNNIEEILRLAQYDVLIANNGKHGSELAIKFQPDIIVCDILMPELDGFGVLFVLSKNKQTANIPFIFLSAKAQKSDIRKGMDLGADDYLCKPFDDNELLSAIESRLKKNSRLNEEEKTRLSFDKNTLRDNDKLSHIYDLFKNKHKTKYKKKEIIYHNNDLAQNLFILKEGRVKSFQTHEEGKEYITRVYKSGEFFGYTAILSGQDYSDTATALEDCEIYKVSKDDFINLIGANSSLLTYFIKLLSEEKYHQEEQLLNLAYNSVRKRTADALILLAESQAKANDISTGNISISIGRDDLASLAGTAIETVIRCLGEMKEDGIISVHHREIVILDIEALSRI